MTQKEMDETFIATLKGIARVCDKIAADNIYNSIATIKVKCIDMLYFYKKFPVSPWHLTYNKDFPDKSAGDRNHLPFLCVTWENKVIPAYYVNDYGFIDGEWNSRINAKYWMEIPQFPKENELPHM